MNSANVDEWTQVRERVIDRSSETLPPSWVATGNASSFVEYPEEGIFLTSHSSRAARAMVEAIGAAQEVVVVSSFLFAHDDLEEALLSAARRGVRVYLMTASEMRLKKGMGWSDFDEEVYKDHCRMLDGFAGRVLLRSANHFHAKVLLVDPLTSPVGYLSTANFTNMALSRNEEFVVSLDADQVRQAFEWLRWEFWEKAEHELREPGKLQTLDIDGRVPAPDEVAGKTLVANTGLRTEVTEVVEEVIESAKEELLLSSFGWELEHPIVQKLIERCSDGLRVKVLSRPREAAMPALIALRESGAEVVGYRWLHAKAVCADRTRAIVMSANFDSHSLDGGFELGVELDERAALLSKLMSSMFEAAPQRLEVDLRREIVSGRIIAWEGGGFRELDVEESIVIDDYSDLTAPSADRLSEAEPTKLKEVPDPKVARTEVHRWTVFAPLLPTDATEVGPRALEPSSENKESEDDSAPDSYSPPVFKTKDNRLVVAVDHIEDLKAARLLLEEIGADGIVVRRAN